MITLKATAARKLRRDIRAILERRPDRRSVGSGLMARLRADGWADAWANYRQFVALCDELALHRYTARGRRNRIVEYIGLDAPRDVDRDFFADCGFVIRASDGHWVNRGNPPKTTPLRSMARVWKTRSGVEGYCGRHGHALDGIQRTRDVEGANDGVA